MLIESRDNFFHSHTARSFDKDNIAVAKSIKQMFDKHGFVFKMRFGVEIL